MNKKNINANKQKGAFIESLNKYSFIRDTENGFVLVSNYMLNDKKITPLARDIFMQIQKRVNLGFKHAEIYNHLNITNKTYFKHLKLLKENGYLEVIKTNQKANEYKYILKMTPDFKLNTTNLDLNNLEKYNIEFLSHYINTRYATKNEIKEIEKYISNFLNMVKAKWLDN